MLVGQLPQRRVAAAHAQVDQSRGGHRARKEIATAEEASTAPNDRIALFDNAKIADVLDRDQSDERIAGAARGPSARHREQPVDHALVVGTGQRGRGETGNAGIGVAQHLESRVQSKIPLEALE